MIIQHTISIQFFAFENEYAVMHVVTVILWKHSFQTVVSSLHLY